MSNDHTIVVVTPAGRRHYLEILKRYVLADEAVQEWQLWDNCRRASDRDYIEELERLHPKIRVVRAGVVDGTNKAINQFYQALTDRSKFYIKMDDDIVYLPDGFARRLYEAARGEQGRFLYWSPLVINNAICSWLVKHHSRMHVPVNVTAAASCAAGWKNPFFAEQLHRAFIGAIDQGSTDLFKVPNFQISLARFSINCIGIFGSDVAELGSGFCPSDCDDEEWISAILPSNIGKPGRIIGDLVIAHFAFFTQEIELLQSGILDEYFRIAGVSPVPYPRSHSSWRKSIRRAVELRLFNRYRRPGRIVPRSAQAHAPLGRDGEALPRADNLRVDLTS